MENFFKQISNKDIWEIDGKFYGIINYQHGSWFITDFSSNKIIGMSSDVILSGTLWQRPLTISSIKTFELDYLIPIIIYKNQNNYYAKNDDIGLNMILKNSVYEKIIKEIEIQLIMLYEIYALEKNKNLNSRELAFKAILTDMMYPRNS